MPDKMPDKMPVWYNRYYETRYAEKAVATRVDGLIWVWSPGESFHADGTQKAVELALTRAGPEPMGRYGGLRAAVENPCAGLLEQCCSWGPV